MKHKKLLKVLFALILGILVGALGSGFWEVALSSFFTWLRDQILTITTLGIQTFKDSTYKEIALGFSENASHRLLFFSSCVLSGLLIVAYASLISKSRSLKQRRQEALLEFDQKEEELKELEISLSEFQSPEIKQNQIAKDTNQFKEKIKEEIKDVKTSIEEGRKELSSSPINFLVKISYCLLFLVVAFSICLMVYSTRLMYINSAVTHFHQLRAICSPYLEAEKEKQIISAFAQIQNQKDYINITNELKEIAKINNLYIPKFIIW